MRILILEDGPDDYFLLESALKASADFEFDVSHATRLAEACALLRRRSVDIILTDLSLPNSMGLETVKRVISDAGATPVIVMSESADDHMREAARAEGARACWSKSMLSNPNLAREIGNLAKKA